MSISPADILLTAWYPRYETQKRISAFYLMGASVCKYITLWPVRCTDVHAAGFGNIIAYGFSTMAGIAGRPGYQWIL